LTAVATTAAVPEPTEHTHESESTLSSPAKEIDELALSVSLTKLQAPALSGAVPSFYPGANEHGGIAQTSDESSAPMDHKQTIPSTIAGYPVPDSARFKGDFGFQYDLPEAFFRLGPDEEAVRAGEHTLNVFEQPSRCVY
jgi:hypothetical protein